MTSKKTILFLFTILSVACSGAAMAQEKPLIKIVATGGTIAHLADDSRVPFEEVIADIRKNYPETHKILDSVSIEVDNTISIGSSSITPNDVLKVARAVDKAAKDPRVKGVIITHGTVTSEETAYYLHLLVRTDKPIVLTNSQREHRTLGNDGDHNFIDSLRVMLSPEAAGKGLLLVHNQTISSAREFVKNSGRPGTFLSGEIGFMGLIGNAVAFYRAPTRRHTSRSEFNLDSITSLPRVEIVVAHPQAEPKLAQFAVDNGAKGIIVLGFVAAGIPHPSQRPGLDALVAKGIPVVLTSRGGVNNWLEPSSNSSDKYIRGDNLPMQKARILLELALTKTTNPKEIQRIFAEY